MQEAGKPRGGGGHGYMAWAKGHVTCHGGACLWAYMHVAGMHEHGDIVAWVYRVGLAWDIKIVCMGAME